MLNAPKAQHQNQTRSLVSEQPPLHMPGSTDPAAFRYKQAKAVRAVVDKSRVRLNVRKWSRKKNEYASPNRQVARQGLASGRIESTESRCLSPLHSTTSSSTTLGSTLGLSSGSSAVSLLLYLRLSELPVAAVRKSSQDAYGIMSPFSRCLWHPQHAITW